MYIKESLIKNNTKKEVYQNDVSHVINDTHGGLIYSGDKVEVKPNYRKYKYEAHGGAHGSANSRDSAQRHYDSTYDTEQIVSNLERQI
jgi:hypothetical protein